MVALKQAIAKVAARIDLDLPEGPSLSNIRFKLRDILTRDLSGAEAIGNKYGPSLVRAYSRTKNATPNITPTEALSRTLVDMVRTERDGEAIRIDVELVPYIIQTILGHYQSRRLNDELDRHPIQVSGEPLSKIASQLQSRDNTLIHYPNETISVWTRNQPRPGTTRCKHRTKRRRTADSPMGMGRGRHESIKNYLSPLSQTTNEDTPRQWKPVANINIQIDDDELINTAETRGSARWADPCVLPEAVGQLLGERTLVKAKAHRQNDKIP